MSGKAQSKARSYEWVRQQYQNVYVPATAETSSPSKLPKSSILLALQERPDQICGIAQRVGCTNEANYEQVIYRLKLKAHLVGFFNTTIPGFFVLENGVFLQYVPPDQASSIEI
jgi:hypothetical protein